MITTWDDLEFWSSEEWQNIQEKLDDLDRGQQLYNPERHKLFTALDQCSLGMVKVAFVGQDPYPRRDCGTGLAFSVSKTLPSGEFPPTLRNIFKEYQRDLHYPEPTHGDLSRWVHQGVLLWNSIPMCMEGTPKSCHWEEWIKLTEEIVKELDTRQVVFVLLGSYAQDFLKFISVSPVITTSHPSPLKVKYGFKGSRIFSHVNAELCKLKKTPIDWRL